MIKALIIGYGSLMSHFGINEYENDFIAEVFEEVEKLGQREKKLGELR